MKKDELSDEDDEAIETDQFTIPKELITISAKGADSASPLDKASRWLSLYKEEPQGSEKGKKLKLKRKSNAVGRVKRKQCKLKMIFTVIIIIIPIITEFLAF
ncbi:unnamed protein product [Trichobilharzia regenti]|nr:unnamed protein product [Trichobilharzia regenti]